MRIVTKKELKTLFGIPYCNTHLLRMERAGTFPPRTWIGPNRVGWLETAIIAWIRERFTPKN